MNHRIVTRAAEDLVSKANTEDDLVTLIAHCRRLYNNRRLGSDEKLDEQIARETVKRAYQKLATFG